MASKLTDVAVIARGNGSYVYVTNNGSDPFGEYAPQDLGLLGSTYFQDLFSYSPVSSSSRSIRYEQGTDQEARYPRAAPPVNNTHYDLNSTIPVFSQACGPDGCNASCQSVDEALASDKSLWNCYMFLRISSRWRQNALSDHAIQVATSLGYTNASIETSENVYHTIFGCLNAYESTLSYHWPDYPGGPNRTYPSVCIDDNARVIADICGIGVAVSYVIQLALALVIFTYLKGCISWSWWLHAAVDCLRQKTDKLSRANRFRERLHHHAHPMVGAAVEFQKAQCVFSMVISIASLLFDSRKISLDTRSAVSLTMSLVMLSNIPVGCMVALASTLSTIHVFGRKSWFLVLLTALAHVICIAAWGLGTSNFSKTQNFVPQGAPCGTAHPATLCYLSSSTYAYTDASLGTYNDDSGVDSAFIVAWTSLTLIILLLDLLLDLDRRLGLWIRRGLETFSNKRKQIRHTVSIINCDLEMEPPRDTLVHKPISVVRHRTSGLTRSSARLLENLKRGPKNALLQGSRSFAGNTTTSIQHFFTDPSRISSLKRTRTFACYMMYLAFVTTYLFLLIHEFQIYRSIWIYRGYRVSTNTYRAAVSQESPTGSFVGNEWSFGQIVAISVWAGPALEFLLLNLYGVEETLYRLSHKYYIVSRKDFETQSAYVSLFLQRPLIYLLGIHDMQRAVWD